jgi:hypothetical protein
VEYNPHSDVDAVSGLLNLVHPAFAKRGAAPAAAADATLVKAFITSRDVNLKMPHRVNSFGQETVIGMTNMITVMSYVTVVKTKPLKRLHRC